MSLRYAVLAVLLDGPASGYDLARRFDRSVANFWHATRQQIYAELERMEIDALVRSELLPQPSRPDKRLYRTTSHGQRAMRQWLGLPSRPTAIKDEMLVRVQAASAGQAPDLLTGLAVWRQERAAQLERYLRQKETLLAGRREDDYLAAVDRPGGYLTLLRGIAFERENLAWADHVSAVLSARIERSETTSDTEGAERSTNS